MVTPDEQHYLARVQEAWLGLLLDSRITEEWGVVGLQKFMFTWAILAEVTPTGYTDRWCYQTYDDAKAAYDAWNPDQSEEPGGPWVKHIPSLRRRQPDGSLKVEP